MRLLSIANNRQQPNGSCCFCFPRVGGVRHSPANPKVIGRVPTPNTHTQRMCRCKEVEMSRHDKLTSLEAGGLRGVGNPPKKVGGFGGLAVTPQARGGLGGCR